MKLKDLSSEDLEEMSMTDIAHMILTESNKEKKIKEIFEEIAKILDLSKKEQENKIGDFYTAISTDKRFIVLDDGTLDLKSKHSVQKVKVEDIDDDDAEDFMEEEDLEEDIEEDEEDDYNSTVDETDDNYDPDEDLKDLVIIEDEGYEG